MIALTIPALQEYLQSLKLEPALQKETDQLIVVIKIEGIDFPLFFRVYEGGQLLQMLAVIPCKVKASAVADLGRLMHLINRDIDLPGFGMDEKAGVVFYRSMMPVGSGEIDEKVIEMLYTAIKTLCQTFAGVISAVATGAATYQNVLDKMQKK